MIMPRFIRTASVGALARCAFAAALLTLASCQAAPPVQEMSDARQAIAVARAAGAVDYAEEDMREAEISLEIAQRKLSERAYSQARREALLARDMALKALSIAERSVSQQPN